MGRYAPQRKNKNRLLGGDYSKIQEIVDDNDNMLIPWVLIAAYAYYQLSFNVVPDNVYDDWTKRLSIVWDHADHMHKHLITYGNPCSVLLNEEDYPSRVKAAAYKFARDGGWAPPLYNQLPIREKGSTMSLEQAIAENTAAIKELTAALGKGGVSTGGSTAKATTTTSKGKVTKEQMTAVVTPLVQEDGTKAKVKAVLEKFGLKKLGDAKEDQYSALTAEFQAIADAAPAVEEDDDII